ncbi:MAG: ThuA domain-containing protein [Balneolales bacterium]
MCYNRRNLLGNILCVSFAVILLGCSQANQPQESAANVLIVGGGQHHDFEQWTNLADSTTISNTGAQVRYTDNPAAILPALEALDILYLSNNQPLSNPALRRGIFDFADSGKSLLLVHSAIWYNWGDWPEYNRELVGGGASSHGPLGEFEVKVIDPDHPLMQSVPASFRVTDELYRFETDEEGPDMHVLAVGIEPDTGDEYPVAWTVKHGDGRIVNITLGHDGDSHEHEAYIAILENSMEWLHNN